MTPEEIIRGLMLKLEDENIDCMKLRKRIGKDNYKEWEKAHDAAFELIRADN